MGREGVCGDKDNGHKYTARAGLGESSGQEGVGSRKESGELRWVPGWVGPGLEDPVRGEGAEQVWGCSHLNRWS